MSKKTKDFIAGLDTLRRRYATSGDVEAARQVQERINRLRTKNT